MHACARVLCMCARVTVPPLPPRVHAGVRVCVCTLAASLAWGAAGVFLCMCLRACCAGLFAPSCAPLSILVCMRLGAVSVCVLEQLSACVLAHAVVLCPSSCAARTHTGSDWRPRRAASAQALAHAPAVFLLCSSPPCHPPRARVSWPPHALARAAISTIHITQHTGRSCAPKFLCFAASARALRRSRLAAGTADGRACAVCHRATSQANRQTLELRDSTLVQHSANARAARDASCAAGAALIVRLPAQQQQE